MTINTLFDVNFSKIQLENLLSNLLFKTKKKKTIKKKMHRLYFTFFYSYWLAYIHEMLYVCYLPLINITMDTFLTGMMHFVAVKLKILKIEMKKLCMYLLV